MKRQFCGLLYDTGFIHSPDPDHDEANFNSVNTKLIKAVLCAGLYPNVAKIVQNRSDKYVNIHTLYGEGHSCHGYSFLYSAP